MNLQIHLNHLGYETRSAKRAILRGSRAAADPGRDLDFLVKDSEKGAVELRAKARYCGPIAHWKDWLFWTLDFSELAKVGRFVIEMPGAASGLRSEPFEIAEDLLVRRTVPAVLKYFRSQRCTGILDEADRDLGFFGPRGIGSTCTGGGTMPLETRASTSAISPTPTS